MNLAELLRAGEIRKVEPDMDFAIRLLNSAQEGIKAAEDNVMMKHCEVAFSVAYNSMLNAGRALMFAKGYRASSETHHKSVVNFCAAFLPEDSQVLVNFFNKSRVRRHDIVYGEIESGSIAESEAKTAIAKAKNFLALAGEKIRK